MACRLECGSFGRHNATMLSLVSRSLGISISCTEPGPQSLVGSIQALGRFS